jgi:sucrose-6-phosphate hydrolase SacC (GH32 family)
VKELEEIRENSFDIGSQAIDGRFQISNIPFEVTPSEMIFEFELLSEENKKSGIELSNNEGQKLLIGFDRTQNKFYVDRTHAGDNEFSEHFPGIHYAPSISGGNKINLHAFIDVASVELFADGGKAVITDIFFPEEVFDKLTLFTEGGPAELKSGKIIRLDVEK